eukprot:259103_1
MRESNPNTSETQPMQTVTVVGKAETLERVDSIDSNDLLGGVVWKDLSIVLDGREYIERCKQYYSFMASISGLVSGFTFIALSEAPSFAGTTVVLYSVMASFAFVLSLTCTIVSTVLWVSLVILGAAGAKFFGRKFSKFHNIPAITLVLSFLFMGAAIVPSIWGNYGYKTGIFGGILVLLGGLSMLPWYIYVKRTSVKEALRLIRAKNDQKGA